MTKERTPGTGPGWPSGMPTRSYQPIIGLSAEHESEIRVCLDSIGFLGLLGQCVTHGKIVVKLSPTKDVCDPCGGCPTSVHCRSWLAVSGAQGVPCCQERLSYVHVTHDLLQMAKLLKAPKVRPRLSKLLERLWVRGGKEHGILPFLPLNGQHDLGNSPQ